VFRFLAEATYIFRTSATRADRPGPTQLPVHWVSGALSPEVKRSQLEDERSHKLMSRLKCV